MTFTVPWASFSAADGTEVRMPILDVHFRAGDGRTITETFIVDSGADISMAPRRLCDLLGLSWNSGTVIELEGISPRPECKVVGSIHQVEVHIREAARRLAIPFCFAEGNAPALLGREGFFDAFRICFDKDKSLTSFELRDS